MAFLFNGYSTNDADETGKQNIFSTDQGGGSQSDGGTGGGQVEKTSIDGGSVPRGTSGSSSGSATGGTGGAAAPATGGYNPKAIQSAYSRIGQSLQLPTQSIGKAQGQIQQGQQKLQEESNRYAAAGETAKEGYKLDQTVLQSAAAGDKDAYAKTAGRLTQAAPEVEAFKGLGDELPDVSQIRDNTKAYASEAGPNYTAGQSRLDAALLKRNPEYLRIQQQLLADQSALSKQNDEAITSKTDAQKAALQKAYGDSTADIKTRLGGLSNEIIDAAKGQETAEDQRRAGLDVNTISKQEYAKLKTKIQQDLKTADPRSQQYRAAQYLDSLSPEQLLGQYVNIDKDTDWHEFVDQTGADRYNRVEGLLGSGNMLTPALSGPGADYAFDEGNAYRSILEQITGQRQAADQRSQTEMDQIIAKAQGTAKSFNDRDGSQSAREKAQADLTSWARAKYGDVADRAGNYVDALFSDDFGDPRLSGLIRDNAGTDWRGVLNGADAARLSDLSRDMGGIETYSQGGYAPEYEMEALSKLFDELYAPHLQRARDVASESAAAPGRMSPSNNSGRQTKRFNDVR